jgi:predicted secreted hydrolase
VKVREYGHRTGLANLAEAGESYYYSRTRLFVSGTISVHGVQVPVTGRAWFDHQWGNFDPRAIGWDWFALQLSDGSDVMFSLVRDEADQPLYCYGTFIGPDGTASHLTADQFQVLSTESWTSPSSGAVYPAGWEVSIPDWGVEVTVMPVIDRCEFDATSTTQNYYWEGEVTVSGSHNGKAFKTQSSSKSIDSWSATTSC